MKNLLIISLLATIIAGCSILDSNSYERKVDATLNKVLETRQVLIEKQDKAIARIDHILRVMNELQSREGSSSEVADELYALRVEFSDARQEIQDIKKLLDKSS